MLDVASFPEERQRLIRERLNVQGRVSAADLAAEFGVSDHTVRRDLGELAEAGLCKRVYGGAVALAAEASDIQQRYGENRERKDQLAAAAVALLQAGQCIFIDAGSTNMAIARALPTELPLIVVTSSPEIAVALMEKPNKEVILLGGRLQPKIGSVLGAAAVQQIERMLFDQCFLGACAIDAEAGLTVFDFEDAELKRALLRQSNSITVAVTNEKIASVARYHIARCSDVTALIVEHNTAPAPLALIAEKGMQIIQAPAAE